MLNKELKIEVPKDRYCRCGKRFENINISVTHDNVLRVIYSCDCGYCYCDMKAVEFI